MQKVAIDGGTLWLDLPAAYDIGTEEDGTVFAVLADDPDLLCIRFSVLTVEKNGDDLSTIDLAADLIKEGQQKGFRTFQVADKAWYEKEEISTHEDKPLWIRFWIAGYRNRKAIISLCCDEANKNEPRVLEGVAFSPRMIESLANRPAKSALTYAEAADLDEHRELILSVIQERYEAYQLPKLRSDLTTLQQVINDRVFSPEQEFEWSSAGIVFGDVLATELGLEWIMQCDEYGAEPALSLQGTSITLFPRTMILKRIENKERMDLEEFVNSLSEHVEELRRKGC